MKSKFPFFFFAFINFGNLLFLFQDNKASLNKLLAIIMKTRYFTQDSVPSTQLSLFSNLFSRSFSHWLQPSFTLEVSLGIASTTHKKVTQGIFSDGACLRARNPARMNVFLLAEDATLVLMQCSIFTSINRT